MTTRLGALVSVTCGLAMLAGCLPDPTEVVVVVDTDLTQFVDFDVIEIQLTPRNSSVSQQCSTGSPLTLPITLGVVPQGAGAFKVTASAIKGPPCVQQFGPAPFGLPIELVATRMVSNVPFVADERRALFIALLRQCMCQGTTCAHALEPECRDVTAPVLTEFDEDNIPHLPASAKTPAP